MRNPKNSWDKMDSHGCPCEYDRNCDCPMVMEGDEPALDCTDIYEKVNYCIGENDMKLMKTLAAAGTDHGKYLRMITVTADITAPFYWWKEYDTYKVGTVANSCSTMHKIQAKEFTLSDFSTDHLSETNLIILNMTIDALNNARLDFLQTQDKRDWWQMIQLLPTSYNQRRTVQFNYAVLKNMYHSRQNHKLDEWREFCQWVKSLPYSELITG